MLFVLNLLHPNFFQVATSILINMMLARVLIRLAWNAGVIRTGYFFGDKGPAYDAEQAKKCTTNKFWTPVRSFPVNYIMLWPVGVAATAGVVIAGIVYLSNQNKYPVSASPRMQA